MLWLCVCNLTHLKCSDSDRQSLQGFSVQFAFGLDHSWYLVDLQPALSVTIQLETAQNTRVITHKDTRT